MILTKLKGQISATCPIWSTAFSVRTSFTHLVDDPDIRKSRCSITSGSSWLSCGTMWRKISQYRTEGKIPAHIGVHRRRSFADRRSGAAARSFRLGSYLVGCQLAGAIEARAAHGLPRSGLLDQNERPWEQVIGRRSSKIVRSLARIWKFAAFPVPVLSKAAFSLALLPLL